MNQLSYHPNHLEFPFNPHFPRGFPWVLLWFNRSTHILLGLFRSFSLEATVMSSEISIKSKTIRRLEVGEAPVKPGDSDH